MFGEGTAQDVAIGVFLHFFGVTGLLCESLHLLVDLLFRNFYVVVGELIFVGEFDFKLGSEGDVELEFEIVLVLDVLCLLLFRHHGLAEHAELLFFDELLEVFTHEAVDFVHLHLRAKTLIDQAGGYFALAETGHFGFRRDILEFLLDSVLIVGLLHLQRDEGAHSGLFESNVHEVWCLCFIYFEYE